jgi:L-aspartate oxidase
MIQQLETDVLIVGAGAAGLFAALHLPPESRIVVVDKGRMGQGSSPWAQGGVAAALGPDDSPELHARDTARVAAGHGDPSAIAVLASEAAECVLELAELGCAFDRDPEGSLHLSLEGGQSVARNAHAGDATGAAIMKTLREHATDRVRRIEGICLKLAVEQGRCQGAWAVSEGDLLEIRARSTVLATGGVGALYASTTNPAGATGDGLALAWEAGAALADLEFVQFHPTALALGSAHQRLLLTEALRGAGAHVLDAEGRRYLFEHHSDGELAPRDVVARAVASRHSWLDCRHLGKDVLEREFPTVVAGCRRQGLDPVTELLPITFAAHYAVGGVTTDLDGRTSIPRLYAAGECACTGVHGANRLASNSLAEALVFGRRAARAIASQRVGPVKALSEPPELARAMEFDAEERMTRLREISSGRIGIDRTADGLRSAIAGLEELTLLPASGDRAVAEVRAGAIVARLIARCALLRTESRGVHHRSDHPDPDPSWAGVRLRISRT